MSVTSKQQLGQKGEDLAEQFLRREGHRILFRNFRYGKSELDIVSLQGDTLIISEVKSYHARPLGAAEYRVDKHKQRLLITGTHGLLSEHPRYNNLNIRFDVIIVDFSRYPAKITWHQAAFWDEQGWNED